MITIMLAVLDPKVAAADPWDRFRKDLETCNPSQPDDVCEICGVEATTVSWGALTVPDPTNVPPDLQAALIEKGVMLYCANSGGVMTASGSAGGVQRRTLSMIFAMMEQRTGQPRRKRSIGGIFEIFHIASTEASGGAPAADAMNVYGGAIPVSQHFQLGQASDLVAQGALIFGKGEDIWQAGFNLNPVFTTMVAGSHDDEALRVILGGAVPFQFVGTSVTDLDFGTSWLVGGGIFAGLSKRFGNLAFGLGTTAEARYTDGVTAPVQLSLRGSYDLSSVSPLLGSAVIQPGFLFDAAAGDSLSQSMQGSVLAGLDIADWVVGYQGMFQGGAMAHGIGVTYISRAGQLAAGGSGS